jgi:hypothetical protein
MKRVIPDWTFSTENWDCCLVWFPDDSNREWESQVLGALNDLSKWYNWDEKSGDVYQAARIGDLIAKSFAPSPETLLIDTELGEIMACLEELTNQVTRIADILEAQQQPDLTALENLTELTGLVELTSLVAALDPEIAMLVSATQQVAGLIGETTP